MTLLAEYSFDEGTGTTTADLTGNGYTLTTSGSGWVSDGYDSTHSGKADFSGVAGPNVLQQSWTVMAWMKRDGILTTPYAAILSNNSSFYFELHRSGDSIECYAGTSGFPSSGTNIIPINTWVHTAVTRKTDGTCTIFVDGEPIASGVGNAMNFGQGTWFVGGANNPNYVLSGSVDTLRLFDEALTSEEIRSWRATPAGKTPPTLLAAYAFNEAPGAVSVKDHSGNDLTATAVGVSFTDGPLVNTRAVTFTGSSQGIYIPRTGTEPSSIGFTAMAWGKGPVDMGYLVKPRGGNSTRSAVGPNWRVRWKDDLHYTDDYSGVDDSQWHHYCVIDSDEQWAILIDGVYYAGGSRAADPNSPASWEDFPWCIGNTLGTGLGESKPGQMIADVRIFQGNMHSSAQVRYWMNTPVSPKGRLFKTGTAPRKLKLGQTEKFFK